MRRDRQKICLVRAIWRICSRRVLLIGMFPKVKANGGNCRSTRNSPLMEGRSSPVSKTATLIQEAIDDVSSVKSTNPTQQSPLRQVFSSSEDTSPSPVQQTDRP